MRFLYIGLLLIVVSSLLTGLIVYKYFPQEREVIKEVVIEKIVYVNSTNSVDNNHNNEVVKPMERKKEPHIAYVIEDGVKKKAGSTYTNKPTLCATLHNRSLC